MPSHNFRINPLIIQRTGCQFAEAAVLLAMLNTVAKLDFAVLPVSMYMAPDWPHTKYNREKRTCRREGKF